MLFRMIEFRVTFSPSTKSLALEVSILSPLSLTDSSVGVGRRDIKRDDELHGGKHLRCVLGHGSSEKARHAKQRPCHFDARQDEGRWMMSQHTNTRSYVILAIWAWVLTC